VLAIVLHVVVAGVDVGVAGGQTDICVGGEFGPGTIRVVNLI
jgi:hypothetical protein